MKHILEQIKNTTHLSDPTHLVELVDYIRPRFYNTKTWAKVRLQELIAYLKGYPEYRDAMQKYILQVWDAHNPLILYTDSGILSNKGFFSETATKVSYKFLPPLAKPSETTTLLNRIFCNNQDYVWVNSISTEIWQNLLDTLELGIIEDKQYHEKATTFLFNAVMVLSQRITAISLEPEIIAKLPEIDDLDSPFFALNKHINYILDLFKKNPTEVLDNVEHLKALQALVIVCRKNIVVLHEKKDKFGVSLRLTHLILRLEQHIKRLRIILEIIWVKDKSKKFKYIIGVFKLLVEAENQKYSVYKHLSDNLNFLAYKVVEHTSKTGQHYISTNKKQYISLLKAALGGGFIVAFLVCFKTLIHTLHLPPFGEAFMYSMNYSLGFMLIHILHFTLATKQPAMTASTIAQALDHNKADEKDNYSALLITQIASGQFISLVGNVIMALPVAYGLGWLYYLIFGHHIANPQKALAMIQSLHPWKSLSLLYAAIAGIFLMTSGLISGYYDNKVVYENIPQRLKNLRIMRFIPLKMRLRFVSYIEHNLGSLAGNFYLGIFLGSMASIGIILGLPLDIRHVTFAAGNFGLALVTLTFNLKLLSPYLVLWTALGIFGIGAMNVLVSFGLSIYIALRSRSIGFRQTRHLIKELLKLLFRRPLIFFLPSKKVQAEIKRKAEQKPALTTTLH